MSRCGPFLPGEAACRVTLYQGLCKGEKMEYVVQKCTEMGVHAIVPVAMARSVQRPARTSIWSGFPHRPGGGQAVRQKPAAPDWAGPGL